MSFSLSREFPYSKNVFRKRVQRSAPLLGKRFFVRYNRYRLAQLPPHPPQAPQLPPQLDLPAFLSLCILRRTSPTINTTTNSTTIVPQFAANQLIIIKRPFPEPDEKSVFTGILCCILCFSHPTVTAELGLEVTNSIYRIPICRIKVKPIRKEKAD